MSRTHRLLLAVAAILTLSSPLAAQEQATTEGNSNLLRAHVPTPAYTLPTATPAPAETANTEALAARANPSATRLMIIGGAAMVLGAVVDGDGGDVLMVGGAVILLVGLYQYLR